MEIIEKIVLNESYKKFIKETGKESYLSFRDKFKKLDLKEIVNPISLGNMHPVSSFAAEPVEFDERGDGHVMKNKTLEYIKVFEDYEGFTEINKETFYNIPKNIKVLSERKYEELYYNDNKLVLVQYEEKGEKDYGLENYEVGTSILFKVTIDLIDKNFITTNIVNTYNDINDLNVALFYFSKGIKNKMSEWLIKNFYLPFPLYIYDTLSRVILKWFINQRGIKASDNYYSPFVNYHITLEELEFNELHLTKTLMSRYNFVGNKLKKIINLYDINLNKLRYLYVLLGIDIFNTIDDDILFFFVGKGNENTFDNGLLPDTEISKSSKNKIVKCLKDLKFQSLSDHITMLSQLKKYGTSFDFSFRNIEEFEKEHSLLGDLIAQLNDKSNLIINYDPIIINELEVPIKTEKEEYEVKLLANKSDYREEGIYQHNCVGSYIERSCHIVSLRSEDKRATIEYSYDGDRRQSLMKYNTPPDEIWLKVINQLDQRVSNLIAEKKLIEKLFIQIPKESYEIIKNSKLITSKNK